MSTDDTGISRRLCAHADDDGAGMHWLEPGEVCDRLAGDPPIRAVRP